VPIMGEEEEGGACGEVTKGAPTEGASTPCKGKSAERRKKIEKSRGKRNGMHGQTTKSAVRVEEELSKRAKEKSRETL